MGGVEPAGGYVLELLQAGKPVVSANKQLVARRGTELFATASERGVQLRFEASVCAAIPVIKILRESLVVSNVHRVLGIVNGTTNFILTRMEAGAEYAEALAEAQRLGYAEADPTDDVSGADAAAKMAILATVAFGSRVPLEDVDAVGIEHVTSGHHRVARELDMVVRLVGAATLVNGSLDVRVRPSLVDRHHPLAAVEGAFNAVMIQGDAIREITLEGPGAGGIETASAVVADMVSVIGTTGTGFLQNDPCWRELPRMEPGDWRSAWYLGMEVRDRPGVLAQLAQRLANHGVSVARLEQRVRNGDAALDMTTHEAPQGALHGALDEIEALEEIRGRPVVYPVVGAK
jgi:homoserine dehydrogenase